MSCISIQNYCQKASIKFLAMKKHSYVTKKEIVSASKQKKQIQSSIRFDIYSYFRLTKTFFQSGFSASLAKSRAIKTKLYHRYVIIVIPKNKMHNLLIA